MKPITENICKALLFAIVAVSLSSCIDEDLSDCPPEERTVFIMYKVEASQQIENNFDATIHDMRFGFWNTPSTLFFEQYIEEKGFPEDNIFEVTLPAADYNHLVIANGVRGAEEQLPKLLADVCVLPIEISSDTVMGLSRAPFAGKLFMPLGYSEDAFFTVYLKPVVGYVKLDVSYTTELENVRCYISGTKAGYNVWDEIWIENPLLVTDGNMNVADIGENQQQFAFYAFPSIIEDTKAPVADGEWKVYFYANNKENNEVTQYIFTLYEPLLAGHVFEASFRIGTDEGWTDAEAGVTINTEWKPGTDYDNEM